MYEFFRYYDEHIQVFLNKTRLIMLKIVCFLRDPPFNQAIT